MTEKQNITEAQILECATRIAESYKGGFNEADKLAKFSAYVAIKMAGLIRESSTENGGKP